MAWDRPGRAEGSRTHGYLVEVLRGRSASRQAVLKSCRLPADLPCVMARLWPGRQIVQASNVFNIWRLQDNLDYEKYLQAFTKCVVWQKEDVQHPRIISRVRRHAHGPLSLSKGSI